ncbi:MAG: HAMP domain-containing sensor histidine kinase [Planctomycetota bacterium]
MSRSRTWWLISGGAAVIVIGALVWISVVVLKLERDEMAARSDAEHQESLRLALWRMDSWLAPHLAREGSRPSADYESLTPAAQAYTAELCAIEEGEVLTPSPLLASPSPYIEIHFQVEADGRITSPQAPSGRFGELLVGETLPSAKIEANSARLGQLASMVTPEVLGCAPAAPAQAPEPSWIATDRGSQQERNFIEAQKRQQTAQLANMPQVVAANQPQSEAGSASTVGPLVALWVNDELMCLRSVLDDDERLFQGFIADWSALRSALLDEIDDLLPDAALEPLHEIASDEEAPDIGQRLAMLPVSLNVAAPDASPSGLTPARLTLAITWFAVIAGFAAVAGSLRSSVAFARTRSRFASAVTHELRTPLTTFRLYTEALANGMVEDEATRREYFKTLDEESARLSALVENVLGYAQLEEGHQRTRNQTVSLDALIERLAPSLRRRAEAGGMTLEVGEIPDSNELDTDVDAVGQILFNLVDNACKYAGEKGHRTIEVNVSVDNGMAHVDVQDHGPGIPHNLAAAIFSPFERGEHADDPSPGLGLGLSLSRSLARELGGDLKLIPNVRDGACFRLTLPLS